MRAAGATAVPGYHPSMTRTGIQLTGARTRMRWTEAHKGESPRPSTVDRGELARRALDLAGRFRSGCHDLAEAHDQYLDEAFDS